MFLRWVGGGREDEFGLDGVSLLSPETDPNIPSIPLSLIVLHIREATAVSMHLSL